MTGRATPDGSVTVTVLQAIVDGINAGDLDGLMSLYEPNAAFAAEPGRLAHGLYGLID